MLSYIVDGVDVFNPIEGKLDRLIEYFVDFYGEENREKIASRLKNTTYFFIGEIGAKVEHTTINDLEAYFDRKKSKVAESLFKELGVESLENVSCFKMGKEPFIDLAKIVKDFKKNEESIDDDTIKIAIVGRPNVGKSSITNKILGFSRVVVSDVAGTTRDAIETDFKYNGQKYTLIDTAGLRRQRSVEKESVEGYSVIRSMEAIERADVVLIVINASEDITEQDVRIAGYVHEAGKPSVIVMNKWDLVEKNGNTINAYQQKLKSNLSFMDYVKSVYVSAKTGQRLTNIIQTAKQVYDNSSRRISTGTLNEMLSQAILSNEPPYRNGKRLKINYITQYKTNPPTFILFCNDATLMHFSYLRYLENRFRQAVDFSGTPIKFITRSKGDKD